MALELPKSRAGVRQIQIQKRQVPIEQIMAVRGQSPVAAGIDTVGQVLGKALQRKAQLQQQAQVINELATAAGEKPPTAEGVTPDIYEKSLTIKGNRQKAEGEEARKNQETYLKALQAQRGYREYDSTTGKYNEIPGLPIDIKSGPNGLPMISLKPDVPIPPAKTVFLPKPAGGADDDKEQNRLEHEARQAVQSLRGDKSLADAESKRDASITVFNTIEDIKSKNRLPSKLEYYDLLGQMWKARTGAAPTDSAIRDLDAKTFQGDIAKAATYFTGQPVGATTEGVLNNIQDFARTSGLQADQLHEGYMSTHLIKPTGLRQERWLPILQTGRGKSFSDAVKLRPIQSPKSPVGWASDKEQRFQEWKAKHGR